MSQSFHYQYLAICFRKHLLSYDIEAFVVFEKLVHSNDVGVILGEEDIECKGEKKCAYQQTLNLQCS